MQSNPLTKRLDLSRFLQKRPNVLLAKLLPLSIYRQYLSFLGLFYYGMNGRERKHISQSLRYVLGHNVNRIAFQSILWKTYFGIFEHYFEKMINAHKDLSEMTGYLNDKISFSGRFWLDQTIAANKGCILVTGHFGAVEYLPLFLASNHYRPSMILRFKTNRLREALLKKSKSVDLELIDADNPSVIFQALNAIKQGRILITLCDEIHSWRPCTKNKTSLFGQNIPKDRTLDILYKRSKAPACFGILRRENSGYDFSVRPLADGQAARSICESSWQQLEKHVYASPEQWYQWPSFYPEFAKYMSNMECYDY